MPFCKNCGRQLSENEACNCTANQNNINTNFNQTPPPPPPVNPQSFYGNPGQPVNVQVIQKKSSAGPIIAVIIVIALIFFLVVGGILAAILVPAMIGYTKKSKISTYNSDAKTIVNTINSSLVELNDKNYNVGGTYIISSKSSNSYIVEQNLGSGSAVTIDTIMDTAKLYQPDIEKNFDWFVVVENGVATYAAASDDWHSKYTGTYPLADVRNGPVFYGDNYKSDSSADLQDLYNWTLNKLR